MKHKTFFALLVVLAGAMAVLLSLISFEESQYTAPPPVQTPIAHEIRLIPNQKHMVSQSPLPAGDTGVPAPTPTPPPMDREAYGDGDLWIQIPSIDVNAPVIDGTTLTELKKGPGLYEKSPMPDEEDGNVCIAGHRTTYGAWFRRLDSLVEGEEIILFSTDRQFVYEVEEIFVVDRYDWSVTDPTGYTALTLTACHPPGSARQRIVARAKRSQR